MGSYFADGLKDLSDEAPRQRRSSRRKTPRPRNRSREGRRPEAAASSSSAQETVRQPRPLAFDPLQSPSRPRQTQPQTEAAATEDASMPAVNQETQNLIANITALFSELGTDGGNNQEAGQDDLTENILQSLNTTADEEDAAMGLTDNTDEATIGKVLAESVMKQLLAKSILYEPMKVLCLFDSQTHSLIQDLSDRYSEWLTSDAAKELTFDDLDRHRALHESIRQLIHVYETEPDNMPKLMELFEQSQSYGSPPEAIYESLVESTDNVSDDSSGPSACFQQ